MRKNQIIKAWKDPEYRSKIDTNTDLLPDHPAGWVGLAESELSQIYGGAEELEYEQANSELAGSLGCCTFGPRVCGFTLGALTYGCCPPNTA